MCIRDRPVVGKCSTVVERHFVLYGVHVHDTASTDESYPVLAIPARPVHNKLVFGLATGQVLDQVRARIIGYRPVSYTHLRAHETRHDLVCRLLLEKKK